MKLNLIYYKNILDIAVKNFFDHFNNDFTKIGGYYVLGKAYSKKQLIDFFQKQIYDVLLEFTHPWNITQPEYFIVIGSCMPNDNIMLNFKDDSQYFPSKLQKLLDSNIQLKYVLKESDIKIDIILFNDIFIQTFNMFFERSEKCKKILGDRLQNIIFVQHKNFDSYTMFKTIKFLYGKSNCVNVWKTSMLSYNSLQNTLHSINGMISKYVNNKTQLNSSKIFKTKVKEVKDFMDSIIGLDCQTTKLLS